MNFCTYCIRKLSIGEICMCTHYLRIDALVPIVKQIPVEKMTKKMSEPKILDLSSLKYPVYVADGVGNLLNCEDQDELEEVIDQCCNGPAQGCEILTVAYEITGIKKEYFIK